MHQRFELLIIPNYASSLTRESETGRCDQTTRLLAPALSRGNEDTHSLLSSNTFFNRYTMDELVGEYF